jgi:hypothetical protein
MAEEWGLMNCFAQERASRRVLVEHGKSWGISWIK